MAYRIYLLAIVWICCIEHNLVTFGMYLAKAHLLIYKGYLQSWVRL